MADTEPTVREQVQEMLFRQRTPAELIHELEETYKDSLDLRHHILLYQASQMLTAQGEAIERIPAQIVEKVRMNCTPSSEAYAKGGDYIVREVADWIENPPAWVKAPWVSEPHLSEGMQGVANVLNAVSKPMDSETK